MSKSKMPIEVKLIMSLITKDSIGTVLSILQERFGNIDFISEKIDFNHTKYYNSEMGENLFRKIVSFEDLINPDKLPKIKIFTNSLEDKYVENGKRKINIDPGYISKERLVLATCKNFSHRIYLSEGVYADLTLIYRGKNFQPLEWTFPDYAEEGMRRLLNSIRDRYMRQIKYQEVQR